MSLRTRGCILGCELHEAKLAEKRNPSSILRMNQLISSLDFLSLVNNNNHCQTKVVSAYSAYSKHRLRGSSHPVVVLPSPRRGVFQYIHHRDISGKIVCSKFNYSL